MTKFLSKFIVCCRPRPSVNIRLLNVLSLMASPSTRPTDDQNVASGTELKIEHQEDRTQMDNQTIGIKREREEDQEKELERYDNT